MADSSTGPQENAVVKQLRRRLRRASRLLTLMALLLVVLVIADLMDLFGAALAFAGLIVAALLVPTVSVSSRRVSPPTSRTKEGLLPGTRRLAESLPYPCFILAADGTVRYANDRAIAVFGIEAGELLTVRLRYPELVAAFGRVTRGEGPQQVQFDERVPTERTFSAWFAALGSPDEGEGYVLILDDLTEARATERMRADFVANASHELRTPLASLAGFVETLQGPARNDAEARDRFLAMMHEQATRMSRLIDDLLSLSRVEMRAHVRPSERVDLVAILRHVIDTMMPLAKEMGVTIEAELPPDKIMIPGERDELVQVFNNLIENACKYGQSGKRVIVRAEAADGKGPCSAPVIDFGPGIAPEHLPRLTERFYRVDADESRRHRGTGLGLAIVKHIVSRHRARLQIESEPGQGARFVVQFPDSETILSPEASRSQSDQSLVAS
jgi:two-component system phosphate regulon sensor histidine kinase PhoR